MYKQIIISAGLILLICSPHGFSGSRVTSTEEYPISPEVNSINLSGFNGTITWVPVDSTSQGKIIAEKIVRGSINVALDKFLNTIKVEDYSSGSNLVLKATRPKHILGVSTSEVRFTVYASPDQIREFRAQTSNGAMTIDADFYGLLDLKTSNGAITLRSGTGEVQLRTSNGSIDLGKVRFTESSSVRTSNGKIEGTVSFPNFGNFTFENSNGRIDLKMPYDTQGSFDLATSNGTVDFRLGSDVITKKRKVFVSRGNYPSIRLKTSNGSIRVSEDSWGYRK